VTSESRLYTLEPKGTELDYNGFVHITGNGHMILGLQVASKVFKKIVYGVELGKPYALPVFG
jgi:hypothetical protein